MSKKYRFYNKENDIIADNVTLPYTIGGLKADTNYDEGEYAYTEIDSVGNELGTVKVPAFKTLSDVAPSTTTTTSLK